jgi:hypothetical protein
MKILSSFFTTTACAAALLGASNIARAEWITTCSLSVPEHVDAQTYFEFGMSLQISWLGIGRPNYAQYFYPRGPYTGIFYGTKDGSNDLPNGYTHHAYISRGDTSLTGYYNPGTAPVAGTYTRFLDVYDANGVYICTTNTVTTTLTASPH